MRRSVRSFSALALVTSAALFLSACSGSADTSSESATSVATQSGALETVTPGKLTIATGEPAYSPWVIDNAPESGEGFEAAVAYAVAEELGYSKENVQWTRATFDSSIAPGAKDWDINLQQFSITDERKQAVDFSSPYYTTSQAVVAIEGSAAASAQSIAKLRMFSSAFRPAPPRSSSSRTRLVISCPSRLRSTTTPTTLLLPCRTARLTRSSSTFRPRST